MTTQVPSATAATKVATGAPESPAGHDRSKASRAWRAALQAVVGRKKAKKPAPAAKGAEAAGPAAAAGYVGSNNRGGGATNQRLQGASQGAVVATSEAQRAGSAATKGAGGPRQLGRLAAQTGSARLVTSSGTPSMKQGQGRVGVTKSARVGSDQLSASPGITPFQTTTSTPNAQAANSVQPGLASSGAPKAQASTDVHGKNPSPADENSHADARTVKIELGGAPASRAQTSDMAMARVSGAKRSDASAPRQGAHQALMDSRTHATLIHPDGLTSDSNTRGAAGNVLAGASPGATSSSATQAPAATPQAGWGGAHGASTVDAGGIASNPASLGTQTLQSLNAQVHTLHHAGGGQATIQLDPPSLGHVHIQLQLSAQNQAQVRFSAAQPATAQALQASLGQLTASLHQTGIHLQHSEVSATAPDGGVAGQSGQNGHSGQQQQQGSRQTLSAQATYVDPSATKRADAAGSTGVSAYA